MSGVDYMALINSKKVEKLKESGSTQKSSPVLESELIKVEKFSTKETLSMSTR